MKDILTVSSSPHIRHIDTTRGIMLDVLIALTPAAVWGCIVFKGAWLVLFVTTLTAVLAEFLWNLILKKPLTIDDLSAAVTGLLLGMNLPPSIPLWMAAIGSIVAVIVVKQMFGGLGHNFANPAITARIALMVSFPTAMTTFNDTFSNVVSSATPLADSTGVTLKQLFFGLHAGCIGEVSSFLLIVGGIYLVLRRVIYPVIPLAFIGTVAVLNLVTGGDVSVQLLSGGLMLGAIYMATDYTTSPSTKLGKLIFGIGCGVLTFVIRKFASLPEGVSYSILLMNILVPHINRFTLSKPFGFVKEEKKNEG